MGLGEIIFGTVMFIAIWYAIFTFKLKYEEKKLHVNILEKLENQDKKLYGCDVNLKEELGLIKEIKEPSQITEENLAPKKETFLNKLLKKIKK